ncbi:MAG: NADP-dependent oxidoreductase [Bacteroidota bacterium]
MKAIVRTGKGKQFANMRVVELPSPSPGPREIKVQVSSSRINPVDQGIMNGMPFITYKEPQVGGVDGAGIILETGSEVNNFKKGDRVFFYRYFSDVGSWAEEILIDMEQAALIPSNISVEEAGGIALPTLTAFESLKVLTPRSGESILIHAAAGGVGIMAVQMAMHMGLNVIATAGTGDVALLKKMGVKEVIDYKKQSFEEVVKKGGVDFVFDLVGNEVLMKSLLLQPKKVVSVNYPDPNKLHRTGLKVPGILKWVMGLANGKYRKVARNNNVELIGQVTGPNGKGLGNAAEILSQIIPLTLKNPEKLSILQIEKEGMEGAKVGSLITF